MRIGVPRALEPLIRSPVAKIAQLATGALSNLNFATEASPAYWAEAAEAEARRLAAVEAEAAQREEAMAVEPTGGALFEGGGDVATVVSKKRIAWANYKIRHTQDTDRRPRGLAPFAPPHSG